MAVINETFDYVQLAKYAFTTKKLAVRFSRNGYSRTAIEIYTRRRTNKIVVSQVTNRWTRRVG